MSEVQGESLSCNVFGPTGQQYVSPGQRPGTVDRPAFEALKGRHITIFFVSTLWAVDLSLFVNRLLTPPA